MVDTLKYWPFLTSFSFSYSCLKIKFANDRIKTRNSGVGGNRSTNWATMNEERIFANLRALLTRSYHFRSWLDRQFDCLSFWTFTSHNLNVYLEQSWKITLKLKVFKGFIPNQKRVAFWKWFHSTPFLKLHIICPHVS